MVYDPPNLTYPFGAYICVVDVDPGTGEVKVRRFIAVDDCGPRINPMIVEGQVHGGLADGVGMALMQVIAFDEDGNCVGGSFMDYLLPTSLECPSWELGETVTPSPHHPLGCKGVGESATVGSPPAVVNAVIDALTPFGVRARGHAADAGKCVDGHAGPPRAHGPGGAVSRTDIADRAAVLRREGLPFVHATVVLADRPTSAKPGDEALVFADGTIEGFVGGTCAESTVRAQSLALLDSGEPLLLRITASPEPAPASPPLPGTSARLSVHNPCLSGGTLEIFLEPVVPAPLLVVHGDSPIADALTRLAGELGYQVAAGPAGDSRRAAAVVCASHGRDEEDVLTDALAAGVEYVGLVASRKRGEGVVASLDVDEAARARVHTPAGLDIGAEDA